MAPNRATRPAEPGATNAGPAGRGPTDLAPEDLIERPQDVQARHPAVAVACLFGSRARGRTSPLSDIDVAVLLDRAFVGDRFALQLELAGSIARPSGRTPSTSSSSTKPHRPLRIESFGTVGSSFVATSCFESATGCGPSTSISTRNCFADGTATSSAVG